MKSMFRKITLMGLLAVVLVTAGCINYGGGVASSTLPITSKDTYTKIGEVKGRSITPTILGLGLLDVSGHKAIQDAKKNGQCDGLIDVAIENKNYSLILIGLQIIEVNGTGIKFQRGTAE